jgi:hypothetical protein
LLSQKLFQIFIINANMYQYRLWKIKLYRVCLALICFWAVPVHGQVESVTTIENLGFGSFSNGGSGGTIIVSSSGSRSSTGSIILLNLGQPHSQALFDVVAPAGTIISITNGTDATLNGNNGGVMTLTLGPSDPSSPFVADPSGTTRVSLGGTLTIGSTASSPPGTYTGSLYITFNNQ